MEVLRVDGGLTREPLLLQLQADFGGTPVERGAVDATATGAAALAAVGRRAVAGDVGDRGAHPAGERFEPRRDAPGARRRTPSGAPSWSAPRSSRYIEGLRPA